MKRSEMIENIKDYLDLINTESDFSTQDMAEYILSGCCETFGMQPPKKISKKISSISPVMINGFSQYINETKYVCKWEPEDEKK